MDVAKASVRARLDLPIDVGSAPYGRQTTSSCFQ